MNYLVRCIVMMICLVVMTSLAYAGVPLPPPPPGLPAPSKVPGPPRLFAPAPPEARAMYPDAPTPYKTHKKHKKKQKKSSSDRDHQQGLFQSGRDKH